MIEDAEMSGMALAALALSTALIAAGVKERRLSQEQARAIYADARALVHDRAGFVVEPEIAQAADEFLSASEGLAQPDAPRVSNENGGRRR